MAAHFLNSLCNSISIFRKWVIVFASCLVFCSENIAGQGIGVGSEDPIEHSYRILCADSNEIEIKFQKVFLVGCTIKFHCKLF